MIVFIFFWLLERFWIEQAGWEVDAQMGGEMHFNII